jgi:hypothetical protein
VVKEAENMERSPRVKSIGGGDRGRQINKDSGSWTTQQAKKSTGRCFGEPRGKEGKTSRRSPENVGQVDLGL